MRLSSIIRLLVIVIATPLCAWVGMMTALGMLAQLGVWRHGHMDYFSPFEDVGTVAARVFGGVVFFGAIAVGSALPSLVVRGMRSSA